MEHHNKGIYMILTSENIFNYLSNLEPFLAWLDSKKAHIESLGSDVNSKALSLTIMYDKSAFKDYLTDRIISGYEGDNYLVLMDIIVDAVRSSHLDIASLSKIPNDFDVVTALTMLEKLKSHQTAGEHSASRVLMISALYESIAINKMKRTAQVSMSKIGVLSRQYKDAKADADQRQTRKKPNTSI